VGTGGNLLEVSGLRLPTDPARPERDQISAFRRPSSNICIALEVDLVPLRQAAAGRSLAITLDEAESFCVVEGVHDPLVGFPFEQQSGGDLCLAQPGRGEHLNVIGH